MFLIFLGVNADVHACICRCDENSSTLSYLIDQSKVTHGVVDDSADVEMVEAVS